MSVWVWVWVWVCMRMVCVMSVWVCMAMDMVCVGVGVGVGVWVCVWVCVYEFMGVCGVLLLKPIFLFFALVTPLFVLFSSLFKKQMENYLRQQSTRPP